MRWIATNPAAELRAIKPDPSVTWPLLGGRYEKVIAATYEDDDVIMLAPLGTIGKRGGAGGWLSYRTGAAFLKAEPPVRPEPYLLERHNFRGSRLLRTLKRSLRHDLSPPVRIADYSD